MVFYKGFIIWGIIIAVIAAVCFLLWKFYFCRVKGFENRKKTTLNGCILMFVTSATFLFIPLVMCKSTLFTETKDRVINGIKNDIVNKTRDSFYQEAETVLDDIINGYTPDYSQWFKSIQNKIPAEYADTKLSDIPQDVLLLNLSEDELNIISGKYHENVKVSKLEEILTNEFNRAKENVCLYAIKYSKNRTLKDTLRNAFKLLRVGNYTFNGISEENTLIACNEIVEKYSEKIRKNYIKNKFMSPWFKKIVKNCSMEAFTGLKPDEKILKAFNKAKDAFDKLFLRFALILTFIVWGLIIFILFMLREKDEKTEIKTKRNYMFEYNQSSFEEMNAKKV